MSRDLSSTECIIFAIETDKKGVWITKPFIKEALVTYAFLRQLSEFPHTGDTWFKKLGQNMCWWTISVHIKQASAMQLHDIIKGV